MKYCLNCNRETDNFKFCCKSCAVTFNNKKRIKKYRYCLKCGEETKNPKFCSTSCAASFNNKTTKKKEDRFCFICGKKLHNRLLKYCSYSCQQKNYSNIAIEKWISGEWDGVVGKEFKVISRYIINYLLKKSEGKCGICKNSTWLGEPIPLEIHHKDGNWKNNKPENLDIICPNCHAMETKNHKFSNKSPDIYRNKVRKEKTYRNIIS